MTRKTAKGAVRIIAGRWRGRKIPVLDSEGLRPTTDRMRETLFNWLMPVIVGARCLDLFAGSGALAFEALSRGAAFGMLIDRSRLVIDHLTQQITRLEIDNAHVLQASMPGQAKQLQAAAPFDIVFIDPPFAEKLLQASCDWLASSNLLKNPAYIYLEMEKKHPPLQLPDTWQIVAEQQHGQVLYKLIKVIGEKGVKC